MCESVPVFGWISYEIQVAKKFQQELEYIPFEEKSRQTSHINDSNSDVSVMTQDLFKEGTDDIIFEGCLFKFKPGLSGNFIERYV